MGKIKLNFQEFGIEEPKIDTSTNYDSLSDEEISQKVNDLIAESHKLDPYKDFDKIQKINEKLIELAQSRVNHFAKWAQTHR